MERLIAVSVVSIAAVACAAAMASDKTEHRLSPGLGIINQAKYQHQPEKLEKGGGDTGSPRGIKLVFLGARKIAEIEKRLDKLEKQMNKLTKEDF